MSCEEFQELLASPEGPRGPGARAHAEGCAGCRAMLEALSGLEGGADIPAGLVEKLQALPRGDLKPVGPPAPEWLRAAWFVAALAVVSSAGVAGLGTAGWRAFTPGVAALMGVWLALGIGASAWMLARLMIPGASAGRLPALVPAAAAASFAVFSLALFGAETYPRFLPIAGACFAIGSVHAAMVVLAVSRLLRAGWVTDPRKAALAGGTLGAFSGVLVLTVFCAHHDVWHLMLGHVSVLVAVPLAGAYLAQRIAGRRDR